MATILEALYDGAIVAHVDEDSGILIVWNGSETFRVIRVDEAGQCEDVDVFTSYDERLDAQNPMQINVHAARLIASKWWKAQLLPPCAAEMGCLCAGHARGNAADEACDTTE